MRVVELNAHPVDPAIYTALIHDPNNCPDGSTHFRDELPKYGQPYNKAPKGDTVNGLYFQHTVLGGWILIVISLMIPIIFASVWSTKRSDVGGGFTVGQFIVAAISVILLLFGNWNQ
jgi:hypothetical protein